jgi:putative FmdB family regulatory protein
MPLYEYHCSKCGKNFDVIQKFSDAPLTKHEECGGEVTKLMSAPSFHLKGSGWYVTDYGKGGKVPSESGDSKSDDKKSKDSASSESKSGESKSTDTKSSDSKSSDSKSESSKPAEPKPVATPAKSD